MTLDQHLTSGQPKRILALDGGGIRGALTLGYLERMETILKKQHGDSDSFRLCDYFDLIGGTSTGSIIAACLAIGWTVAEIKQKYLDLGGKIFEKKYKWWNIFTLGEIIRAGYDAGPLERELQNVFKDITLGGSELKTGLCIVAKRADTNSVWPFINHPKAKYFDSEFGKNKDILLWKAVRASASAPSYFLPQLIDVGGGLPTAAFVDGGVSMSNNPSLQLLMVATLKGFPFHWKIGAENILMVSVGTGMGRWERLPAAVSKNNLLNWAQQIPDMFMQDASWHNQIIMQWLSKCDTRWRIDGEIGDLSDDLITGEPERGALLTYLRYNLWLDAPTLKELMKKDYTKQEIDGLVEMSNATNRFELFEIGARDAEGKVLETHFPDSFKIQSPE